MSATPLPAPEDGLVRLTKREAAELARLRVLTDKAYRGTALGLLAGRYLRWMRSEKDATPSTIVGYEAVVADLCLRWGDQPVSGLEPPNGREFIRDVIDTRYGHLSNGTRRKATFILKSFFQYLTDEIEALNKNPMSRVRAPKKRERPAVVFQLAEIRQIIYAAPGGDRPDKAAVELLFTTAMRKAGLRQFRLGDYDGESKTIRIGTKGDNIQVIPIPTSARVTLEDHITHRAHRNPATWRREFLLWSERVTPTNRADGSSMDLGDRMKPKTDTPLHNWWKKRVESAGVRYRSMHKVRHTRATQIGTSGRNGWLDAQKVLGHKSFKTTIDTYVHHDLGSTAETLELLEGEV